MTPVELRMQIMKATGSINKKTLREFHGSLAVRNHFQGGFQTMDGKKYVVDKKGQIWRIKNG